MSLAACAALVQTGDPERFMASMAAPVAAREILFPLFAFNLEVARAPWMTAEPMIAEMRLQWWRDVIEAAGQGAPEAHEVAGPLQQLIAEGRLPAVPLIEVVEARRWDIYPEPFADFAAFEAHIEASSGALLWAGASALGGAAEAPMRDIAFAGGAARWLAAIPALEAAGRRPLPPLGAEDLGPGEDPRRAAVAQIAARGLARLRQARGARLGAGAAIARSCWTAGPLLRQAQADPERALAGQLGLSEFARRFGLLRRAALGGW